MEPQGLAHAGVIDDQGRDAAPGKLARDADEIHQLLRAVEAVEVHHARRLARTAFGPRIERGHRAAAIRDLDALAVLPAIADELAEALQHARIGRGSLRVP